MVSAQKVARPRSSRLDTVNERGRPIGEGHHYAVLTDHEIDLMLELREEGFSYSWLAEKFEVHKGTVAKICRGERRAQTPVVWGRARD